MFPFTRTVLVFFIAGLLFCALSTSNIGSVSHPAETGLLIPSGKALTFTSTDRENRIRYIIPPCSAPNAEPSTVLDLPVAPTWIWCENFLNRTHACGRQNVNGLQHLPQSNLCTGRVARMFTGGPYTSTKRALGPGLQSPSMSSIGL